MGTLRKAANMDEYQQAALEVANEIRKELGFEPVSELKPGKPKDAMCCPISNTVRSGGAEVCVKTANFNIYAWKGDDDVGEAEVRIFTGRGAEHEDASMFVDKFDAGEYPDLVAE